jgi:hypothetical protein
MSGYPDSMKGSDMELIELNVSQYGLSLETYFGDVYLYWRTPLLAIGIIVVLRVAKAIRKRVR